MEFTLRDSLIRLQPRNSTVYASQGRTVLATGPDGFIFDHPDHGLWVYQTRMLSRYRWLVDGKPPEMSGNSNVEQHSWLGYYISTLPNWKQTETQENNPAQQTIELRLSRFVGDGMHEDVCVTNHTQLPTSVTLALEVAADFADHEETSGRRKQKGRLTRQWRRTFQEKWELGFDYRVQHRYEHQGDKGVARLHRGIRLVLECSDTEPHYKQGKIEFRIRLAPRAAWHACLRWEPHVEGDRLPLMYGCRAFGQAHNEWDRKRSQMLDQTTEFSAPHAEDLSPVVLETLQRSKRDLAALRLYDLDRDNEITVSAGLPDYVALFGRDSLAASWEADLLATELSRGAMGSLAKYQGTKVDPWRDEEPGKIPHELHTDPLGSLNFNPHGRYYGGVTGSIYYPVVLSGVWHWTGDKDLVRPYVEPALRGLEWADKYSDLDGDGFYEYRTRSQQGEKNQGWKDSDDAIVYPDGSQVKDPLGTCEMQAFVYASKLHFSEVLWWLGEHDLARRLYHDAEELKKRFNNVFWSEDDGFIGMALDSQKKLVRTIGSDPGHCLASGIVDESRAARVAERLMQDDLFSGWGVRTLSARHPAFNPFAYHRGTVWPVENAVFTLAFARYGLHEPMWRLAKAMFEVAQIYEYCRLPETFAGHPRDDEHPFPGIYPKANWPQAWSASAPFTILQAMLGIYPYAPLDVLFLDPWLPEWLPEITLSNMRVGKAAVSIRFRRQADGTTEYRVLDVHGPLHVIRQPSPWSLTAGWGERVRDGVMSLISRAA